MSEEQQAQVQPDQAQNPNQVEPAFVTCVNEYELADEYAAAGVTLPGPRAPSVGNAAE